jgi:hypothetical protein
MARIVSKTYSFNVAGDSVKARVYYVAGTIDPTYDSNFIEVPVLAGQTLINVLIPGATTITEGIFTLMATSFDEAGNESDMGAKVTYPFDFTAPFAPTNGEVV